MLNAILPSKANPNDRARRKTLEQEANFEDLKSIGLKAGVLAVMAGIALYPKISAEADVVERELRAKKDKKDIFGSGRSGRDDRDRDRGGRSDGGRDRRSESCGERRFEREERGYRDGGRRDDGRRRDGGYRESERGGYRGPSFREERRDTRPIMRVDEYDIRKGQGYSTRREFVDDRRRVESGYRERERETDRQMEDGSVKSGGSSRTQEWVEGGFQYLSANDYTPRDRRRW